MLEMDAHASTHEQRAMVEARDATAVCSGLLLATEVLEWLSDVCGTMLAAWMSPADKVKQTRFAKVCGAVRAVGAFFRLGCAAAKQY